jgi:hypothetical protein
MVRCNVVNMYVCIIIENSNPKLSYLNANDFRNIILDSISSVLPTVRISQSIK